MSDFKHCEFRHLMVRKSSPFPAVLPEYWSHVHEDEANQCAIYVEDGWPDASLMPAT